MTDKGRSSNITGYDLFHQAMLGILDEKGLQHEETLEKQLDAFSALDDGMRSLIDKMAQIGYSTLPRQIIIDRLRESFSFSARGSRRRTASLPPALLLPSRTWPCFRHRRVR